MVLCLAALAAQAAGAATAPAPPRLAAPRLDRIPAGPAALPDSALGTRSARALLARSLWGGTYTTSTGETVTIEVSDSYPQDPALAQRWADFLGGLAHGPELSRLTMVLAPAPEVAQVCGDAALACYSAAESTLVAPGDDPAPDISAEAVVTHEYGHHVAANRSNAPWQALDYGTKRWASYEKVCAEARAGQLYPGAESAPRYQLNPGEAFAETYRLLNERNAGLPETPWKVVSQSFYPDDTALALVASDVASPWAAAAPASRAGTLSKKLRARTFTLSTPLDGTLVASVRGPVRARLSLDVLAGATRLGHVSGGRSLSLSTTICGQRTVRVRVTRLAGAGAFRLSLATP